MEHEACRRVEADAEAARNDNDMQAERPHAAIADQLH
jgi:hypothetical protein